MPNLKGRTENALNEGRMLVLGAQVLLGFQFQAVFQPRFAHLSLSLQYLDLAALLCLFVALALLISMAPYHQLVERGRDTASFDRFLSRILHRAVWPFAAALGVDLYIATTQVIDAVPAAAIGAASCLGSFIAWYGVPRWHAAQTSHGGTDESGGERSTQEETPLKDKIRQVLIEARVILPGVQALLGFQFVTVLMEAFDRLPPSSQYVHIASLALITLSTILLMTPAAYHRIAENGRDTYHFYRLASRLVIAATIPLALGLAGDFYVVTEKVTHSSLGAFAAAVLVSLCFCTLWYGYTLYCYYRKRRGARHGD